MKTWHALFLCALAAPGAFAFSPDEERAERARIQAERSQVQAAYEQRERECRQRFVVTSCIDAARRDRRQALERLRQQQELLDEAQRKQRAAQRIDDIRAKVSGEEAQQRDATAKARQRERERVAAASAPASSPLRGPEAGQGRVEPSSVLPGAKAHRSAEDEARHAAEYEKRQREAEAHRQAVERRNASRRKPPAKPLPMPDAVSAPAASAPR
ncbi:MAG TPA: hypothetical protein VJ743_14555 [Albitalea sp.]|nr:hypothetical protein [Albitalea sp.]